MRDKNKTDGAGSQKITQKKKRNKKKKPIIIPSPLSSVNFKAVSPATSQKGIFKTPTHFAELCLKLGYQFRKPELLAQAITTEAAYRQKLSKTTIGHQETLEFLGDGVLKLVVNNLLLKEFPYYNPGQLSKLRDEIIKNVNLAHAAEKMHLHDYMIMDEKQTAQCRAEPNAKILADTVEAIIGAIFKDSREDLKEVNQFILRNSDISEMFQKHKADEKRRHKPLYDAIEQADLALLKKCLYEEKLNPNSKTICYVESSEWDQFAGDQIVCHPKTIVPLSFALDCLEDKLRSRFTDYKKYPEIIAELLQAGADVNIQLESESPLIFRLIDPITVDGGHLDVTFLEFMEKNTDKFSSLAQSFEKIRSEKEMTSAETIFEKLIPLFCQAGLDFSASSWTSTILEHVILLNLPRKFELFIKYGADPKQPNKTGDTPLHKAASLGRVEFVAKLLAAKVPAYSPNKKGETPFDLAKTIDLKKTLLLEEIKEQHVPENKNENHNVLRTEANKLYQEGVTKNIMGFIDKAITLYKKIFDQEIKVLSPSDEILMGDFFNLGCAYLVRQKYHCAKQFLDRAYILNLIKSGEKNNKTIETKKKLDECEQLLSKEAQLERKTFEQSRNRYSMFDTLSDDSRERDKSTDAINRLDEKLFQAVEIAHLETVKKLLNAGGNPDAIERKSGKNLSLLHYAIERYHSWSLSAKAIADIRFNSMQAVARNALMIIELLLTAGVDVNQTDGSLQTPLHIAAKLNLIDVVAQLLQHQADATRQDIRGNFASHLTTNELIKQVLLESIQSKKLGYLFK